MGWFDFIGNAASALGQYAGQRAANNSNRNIGRENNVFSAQQAQLNRDFQERMSNTSWQRGVADMRSAGINPMLSVSQGGASQPLGNSAQGIASANQQNEFANARSDFQSMISTAANLAMNEKQIAKTDAEIELINSKARHSKFTEPVSQLEGSGAGLANIVYNWLTSGFKKAYSSSSSAYKLAKKLDKPADEFGRWNKRTGEVLGYKMGKK